MRIFIPRVPKPTTKSELRSLVAEVLSKKLQLPFTQEPCVTACEIISIKDSLGIIEYYGFLTIEPEKAAKWLLTHFKGQRIHNKLILVREYKSRKGNKTAFAPEDERRRSNLEIEKQGLPDVEIHALDQYSRQHDL